MLEWPFCICLLTDPLFHFSLSLRNKCLRAHWRTTAQTEWKKANGAMTLSGHFFSQLRVTCLWVNEVREKACVCVWTHTIHCPLKRGTNELPPPHLNIFTEDHYRIFTKILWQTVISTHTFSSSWQCCLSLCYLTSEHSVLSGWSGMDLSIK